MHYVFSDPERVMIASCTLNILRKYKNNRKDRKFIEVLVERVASRKDGRVEFKPKERLYIEMFLKDGRQELINEKKGVNGLDIFNFLKNRKIIKNADFKVGLIDTVLKKLERGQETGKGQQD